MRLPARARGFESLRLRLEKPCICKVFSVLWHKKSRPGMGGFFLFIDRLSTGLISFLNKKGFQLVCSGLVELFQRVAVDVQGCTCIGMA